MGVTISDRTGGANAADQTRQQTETGVGSAQGSIGQSGREAAAESLRQTGEERKAERPITTFPFQVAKDLSDALKAHTLGIKNVDEPKFFKALEQYNNMTPEQKSAVETAFKNRMGNQGILEYCESHGSFKKYDYDHLRNELLGKNTEKVGDRETFVRRTADNLAEAIADGDSRRIEYNLKDLSPAEAKKVKELYGKDSNGNDLTTAIERLGNGSEWADKQEQKLGGLTPEIRLERLKGLLASDLAGSGTLALTLLEHTTPADRKTMNELLEKDGTTLAKLIADSNSLDTTGKKLASQYLRSDYSFSPEQTVEADGNEPVTSTKKHHVQKGENLTLIAKRYGVTVEDMLAVNPDIKNKNLIRADKDINLPEGAVDSQQGLAQK